MDLGGLQERVFRIQPQNPGVQCLLAASQNRTALGFGVQVSLQCSDPLHELLLVQALERVVGRPRC